MRLVASADIAEIDATQNLTDAAYYRIREMILDGSLAVGTSVSVVALAGKFGMSRSPVRSAIERLMSERLLSRTASGAGVTSPDRPDLLDALAVRAPLEGLAARLSAAHIDEKALEDLEAIHAQFDRAMRREDQATARRADLEFHQYIQNLSGNECLTDTLERVQTQVVLAAYSTAWTSSKGQAVLEHARILEALRQQDGDTAQAAAERHLHNLTNRVLDEWKRHETRGQRSRSTTR